MAALTLPYLHGKLEHPLSAHLTAAVLVDTHHLLRTRFCGIFPLNLDLRRHPSMEAVEDADGGVSSNTLVIY